MSYDADFLHMVRLRVYGHMGRVQILWVGCKNLVGNRLVMGAVSPSLAHNGKRCTPKVFKANQNASFFCTKFLQEGFIIWIDFFRHTNIEQIKIGRTFVRDLLNLLSAWSATMVGAEGENLEICPSKLPENAFASTSTAKIFP